MSASVPGRLRAWWTPENVEVALGLLLTLALVAAHVSQAAHGGPLWRDEINSQNLSTLPHFGDMGRELSRDSVPLLWLVVLRAWNAAVAHGSDPALRALGLLVGLGLLAVVWRQARRWGSGAPLVALALFAFCGPLMRVGDSVRAYGFGTILILLTLDQAFRVVSRPSARNTLLATLFAVLAVQTLYHNVVLLGIIGVSGGFTALRHRNGKAIAGLVFMAATAGLSMVPYRNTVAEIQVYAMLVKWPSDLGTVVFSFVRTLGAPAAAAWALLLVATVTLLGFRLVRRRIQEPELGEFLWWNLMLGVPVYAFFLRSLSYAMHPWYFFVITAFLAVVLDSAAAVCVAGSARARWGRMGMAAGMGLLLWGGLWEGAKTRMSGIDQAAAMVQRWGGKGDLVVVNPWQMGLTFERYYRGAAPWITVPDFPDHRTHRYDLLLEKIQMLEPIAGELERIASTLRSGHRVWVVGDLENFPADEIPVSPAPPANPRTMGNEMPYRSAWARQVTFLLVRRAGSLRSIGLPGDQPLNPYENPNLFLAEGWRESAR